MQKINIDNIYPFIELTKERYDAERQRFIDAGHFTKIVKKPWYRLGNIKWEKDPERAAIEWDSVLCPGGYDQWKEDRKITLNYGGTDILINKINEIVDRINTYPNTTIISN